MMRRAICGVMVAGALAACSSDVDGTASACPDISGNYSVHSVRVSGTCDPKLDGAPDNTVAFSRNGNGTWSIVIPGVPGGCPGSLDPGTCRYTANCEATGKEGGVALTFSIDYAFSGATFKGSSIGGVRPPVVPTPCGVTYQEQGTKL